MFVTTLVMGVIVSLSGSGDTPEVSNTDRRKSAQKFANQVGVTCSGPLLRDIIVLVLVCAVNLIYLKRGIIDYGFVYALLAMYGSYVLLVLGADAYHILYHREPLVCEDERIDEEARKVNNELTSLTTQPIEKKRHRHLRTSSVDTILGAISNYNSQDEVYPPTDTVEVSNKPNDTLQPLSTSPKEVKSSSNMTRTNSGWIREEDGNEPLVIIHPSHTDEGVLFLHIEGEAPPLLSPLSIQEESNIKREFTGHWRDFISDIYCNEKHTTLDVIFHSLELPFTIARKVRVCSFVLYTVY